MYVWRHVKHQNFSTKESKFNIKLDAILDRCGIKRGWNHNPHKIESFEELDHVILYSKL